MADDLKRVGLVFKADGTADFTKSLKTINALTRENYSAFSLAKSQWDKSTSSLTKLKDTQSYLTKQTETYSSKVYALKSQLEELENAENKDEKAIANKKQQLNNAESSLNKYKKQLYEVNAALESGQAQIEEYAKKVEAFGNKTKEIGNGLTKNVTAPIAGLEVAAVKVGSDFSAGMSEVSAVSGATGKDLEALKDKAKEMGASTKFSASEAAEAMNYMAMAGWNTQQMIDGLPGILNLAAASGESLANTSDIVTDALTAFGLKAEDSLHFADVLAKTSSSANTNVSLMGETFKYVAPLAGTLGFSVEDTALAVGLMANAGIKGSQAGTALKTAIANLASPTDSMKEQMKKLGISITDTNGSVKPLITILEELRTKFGKLSSAQQSAAASTIFGKESMSGMLAIINASDSDFNSLYENIKNADGAAKDMADTMQDNLQGDLTTLSSALEGVGIKVSEVLEPALRDIVEAITDLFSWLNGLDDEITNTIVIIGTVVAAIGPLLVVIGTLAGPISTAISLFGKFKLALFGTTESAGAIGTVVSALSGPVLAIIALVVATVAALVNLWNTNEGFRNAVVDIASQVMSILQNLAVVVQPILDTLKIALLAIWQEALVPLWENFQIVIANIVTLISWLFDGISPIINAIVSLIEIIVIPLIQGLLTVIVAFVTSSAGLLGSFLSSVSGIIDAAIQAIRGLIYFITGVFTGDWRKAWEGVIDIFGAIFNTIRNVCRAPINAVIGCLNGAISGINKMIDGLNTLHFDIPDWVPALGGKSFGLSLSHLGKIPALATGGNLLKGSAIVGERGAELLTQMGTQTRVTPLTDSGGSNKQELIDYQRLADVFVNALVRAGLSIKLDRHELGKLIRSEVY